jgi:hypothetical protein
MKALRLVLVVAALGMAHPASAGELALTFKNGRVTLKAVDTPLRQVLQEWARIGQTRIIGMEKLLGTPITIELVDVPEKQALEILLRPIAGYLAAPRQGPTGPALSRFDRLALLPTSVATTAALGPRPPMVSPPPAAQTPFPDPIALANDEQPDQAETPNQPGVPVFNPNGDPVQPGRPAMPDDPNEAQQPATTPLTAPRPGVLPAPPPQPQPRP